MPFLALPPIAHKINAYKVKAIANKKIKELEVGDIQDIIKVILNTSLEKLFPAPTHEDEIMNIVHSAFNKGNMKSEYDYFSSVVERQIKIEKFVRDYNQFVDDFRQNLAMKKVTLQQIATLKPNGNKIIA